MSPTTISLHDVLSIDVGETRRYETGDGRTFWARSITFRCYGESEQTIGLYAHSPTGLMMPHEAPTSLTAEDRADAAERCDRG